MRISLSRLLLLFVLSVGMITFFSCESTESKNENVAVVSTSEEEMIKFIANLDLALAQNSSWFSHWSAKVGAFEGAGYLAKGLYRSQIDCIMYTRHMQFCKVCQRGLEDVIDMYSR